MNQSKPLLIKLGMFGSLFAAVFMPVFFLFVLSEPEMGTYLINGQEVDRETFQRFVKGNVKGNFLPFVVVGVPLFLAIAYGFWKDRPWSRLAVMLHWVVGGILSMRSGGVGNFIPALIPFGIALWYFYYKPNVVAYYGAIATKPGGPPVASSST